jgi:sugar transferase (PEP-CTERM system associated)
MATVRIFRHHVDSAFLILALAEILLLCVAVYAAALIRFQGDWHVIAESVGMLLPRAVLFALVHWICFVALGLYLPNLRDGLNGVVIRVLVSMLVGSVLLVLTFYLIPSAFMGRGVLALATALALLLLLTGRLVFYRLIGTERLRSRVIVLGAGEQASNILQRMRRRIDQRNFRLLGFYPLAGERARISADMLLPAEVPLASLIRDREIDEIVVAVDDRRGCIPVDDLLQCRLAGINVVDVQTFFERESYKILVDMLNPSHLIFSDGFTQSSITDRLRRSMDIAFCVLLLLVAWPFMLLTMLAIKVEDGWRAPMFYFQERVGAFGRPYNVIKFRSMIENAERQGAQWAQQNDMRVTRVGNIIRKYRIDELPQIFNVLRGDMGFVGPRPERPVFVNELKTKIPFYNERHLVKPGITGWAQLNYAYGASEKDSLEKLQYDLYYVKNRSLLLDLIIMAQTVEVVLFGRGR